MPTESSTIPEIWLSLLQKGLQSRIELVYLSLLHEVFPENVQKYLQRLRNIKAL